MPKLTVENVEIKTATVEIQVITLSDRGITQAVFKQFPERPLIAEDGTLNGVPWGWVNYHPEKCGDDPHLHVVWQLDKDLFRSRVALKVTHPTWFEAASADAWLDAKVRDEAEDLSIPFEPMKDEFTEDFFGVLVGLSLSAEARTVTFCRKQLDDARQAVADHGPAHLVHNVDMNRRPRFGQVPASVALKSIEDRLPKELATLPSVPLDEARERFLTEVAAESDRRKRHRDVRRMLAEMPQLYIAK